MRMDDDELLTLKTCLGDQVHFLEKHPEIDLVGFCTLTAIRCKNPDEEVSKQIYLFQYERSAKDSPHSPYDTN